MNGEVRIKTIAQKRKVKQKEKACQQKRCRQHSRFLRRLVNKQVVSERTKSIRQEAS